MNRQGWIAVTIAVGVAAFLFGGMAGGVIGSQAFPRSSPYASPSPSPSPVVEVREVEVPGPVRLKTPEVCKLAIRRADRALRAYLDTFKQFLEVGFDVGAAEAASITRDDYDEAARRCYRS